MKKKRLEIQRITTRDSINYGTNLPTAKLSIILFWDAIGQAEKAQFQEAEGAYFPTYSDILGQGQQFNYMVQLSYKCSWT